MAKRQKMAKNLTKVEAHVLSIELSTIRARDRRKKVENLVASYYEPATMAELRQYKLLVDKILALMGNPDIDLSVELD